jgi:hypothetical protein
MFIKDQIHVFFIENWKNRSRYKCHKKPQNQKTKQTKQTQTHHKTGGATKTTITRTQGPKKGTSTTSSTCQVTLSNTPQEGNVLIACIGIKHSGGAISVSSISQTGVNWSQQVGNNNPSSWQNVEIWLGIVGSGASTDVTVNLYPTPDYGCTVDICEYNGINTANALDQSRTDSGYGPTAYTGTTSPTTQAEELWIGACVIGTYNLIPPAVNGFTLLDGTANPDQIVVAYLEKKVFNIGTANSGATKYPSGNVPWDGCIATFKAADSNFETPIVRVQGNARGTSTGSDTCVVELDDAPQVGNVLIACIGTDAGIVDSINQTGVEWNPQVNRVENSYGYRDSEIWLGVIASGASKEITITLTSTASDFVANVCEYSGIDTVTPLDQTETESGYGSVTPSTGTTAATTYDKELWIGTCASDVNLSNASDQFYLFDGEVNSTVSVAYLEKKMSLTGQAYCELDPINGIFAGCIATFRAAVFNGEFNDLKVYGTGEFNSIEVDANGQFNTLKVMENVDIYGQLKIPLQGSSGGLLIGGDVNLYRAAPNGLATNAMLYVGGSFMGVSLNVNGSINSNGLTSSANINTYGDIFMQKSAPLITLNALSTSIPEIIFEQSGTPKMSLCYWSDVSEFGVYDLVGSKVLLSLDHNGVLTLPSGGISTAGDIGISKASPNLYLNAVTGNADIFFNQNSTAKMSIGYWTDQSKLGVYDNAGNKALLTLDHSGNMTFNVYGSKLTFYDPYGHAASIQAENSSPTYQWPYLHIQYGLLADDISAMGFLGTSSEGLQNGIGGGAILMGHGFTASGDNPLISLTDSGYDTLWIKAGYSTTNASALPYGNLALGILYVHGEGVNLLGSAALNIADSGGYTLEASLSHDGTNAILYSNADIVLKPTGNVRPYSSGGGQLGTSNFPWSAVYGNYLYEHVSGGGGGDTAHHFDWLDDLQYAKNYKINGDVIDFQASFPFLHKDGSIRLGDVFGYLVGCHKQAAIKLDEQEELAWHLFNGVEAHDSKILALERKIADMQSQISSLKA